VTPIRPIALPVPAGAQPVGGADASRAAAQKAFFDAAMGRAAAPAPPAAATAPRPAIFAPVAAPISRVEVRPVPGADAPARLLRPGSLLDIRV
jgi:hypothetical protein